MLESHAPKDTIPETRAGAVGEPPAPVREELEVLERVERVLRRPRANPRVGTANEYARRLVELRERYAEEKLADDRAAILEEMDRVAALARARQRDEESTLDPDQPYFAHIVVEFDDGPRREYLLGRHTFIRDGITVVDWRNAPISQLYYRCAEGEEFDMEVAGRERSGRLAVRRTVTIRRGRLERVACSQGIFARTEDDAWERVDDDARLEGGARTAARPDTAADLLGWHAGRPIRRDKHLPEIAALLDAEQFSAITRQPLGVVVVRGSAGSGKTTVGLHRLAWLHFAQPRRFRPHAMRVIVHSPALARYIAHVLPALGVRGVPVFTLQRWAQRCRQHHFPHLPARYADDTPSSVLRLKTHAALLPMLAEATQGARGADPVETFDELMTNRSWLRAGLRRWAPGAFSEEDIETIYRWEVRHLDARLEARRTRSHAPDEPTLDREDDVILLRLWQLLRGELQAGRKRKPLRFDHLFVDEVQDFSPMELAVLVECTRDRSITLAGDEAQHIHGQHEFSSWEDYLEASQLPHADVTLLDVAYRSTAPIVRAAHLVLGPFAPENPPRVQRGGPPVVLFEFTELGAAMGFVAEALRALAEREPDAGVGVLTATPRVADEVWRALARSEVPGLRRVRQWDFSFAPGVEVADIRQAKGLEFDYVVLAGVDAGAFPDSQAARHLLHVGMTRAAHQLWLVTWAEPSPLLPPDIERHRMA